jgi:hypothetical protein
MAVHLTLTQTVEVRILPGQQHDLIAQFGLEHLTFNEGVSGSSPDGVTKHNVGFPSGSGVNHDKQATSI